MAAPVLTAWGTDPNDPDRPDLTEPLAWVGEMVKLGVALVNVSMGNPYASPHLLRPFEYPPPDGYETPEHPLVGVDRHFRLAGQIQEAFPTCRWWAAATATCRSTCRTRGRPTSPGGASPSSASGGRRCRCPTSPGCWPRGQARPQARVPHLLLLHGALMAQAQRAGAVRHRLPAVRQGGVRVDLGAGEEEAGGAGGGREGARRVGEFVGLASRPSAGGRLPAAGRALLEVAGKSAEGQQSAWHVATAVFITPFIALAPLNGCLSNALSPGVLAGSAAFTLAAVALFAALGGPWLACLGVVGTAPPPSTAPPLRPAAGGGPRQRTAPAARQRVGRDGRRHGHRRQRGWGCRCRRRAGRPAACPWPAGPWP